VRARPVLLIYTVWRISPPIFSIPVCQKAHKHVLFVYCYVFSYRRVFHKTLLPLRQLLINSSIITFRGLANLWSRTKSNNISFRPYIIARLLEQVSEPYHMVFKELRGKRKQRPSQCFWKKNIKYTKTLLAWKKVFNHLRIFTFCAGYPKIPHAKSEGWRYNKNQSLLYKGTVTGAKQYLQDFHCKNEKLKSCSLYI
jgi:hypothetical protein